MDRDRSRSTSPPRIDRQISEYRRRERSREGSSRYDRKSSKQDDRDEDYHGRKRTRSQSRDRNDHGRSRRDRSRSRDDDRKEKKRKRDKSEERKARKAEKKRMKEEEEARQIAELSVYSATDNPFHDVNLGQQFRWHKKNEKEKKQGLTLAEAQRRDALRRQEAKEELERLNRRRAEREAEQRLREEEEVRMQRLAESAQMAEWVAKDGDFQLEQERRRAAIRIKEKRAKAIDFLALNLRYVNPVEDEVDEVDTEEAGLEIDLDEPYNIFNSLSPDQVEELHDDIERYLQLEQSDVNIDFWTNMMVVCKDRLERIKADQRLGVEAATAVESDITALLQGKSYDHLVALQRQIQVKLSSGEPVDTDYWESLLKKLLVWKAKARLKSLHEVVVRNRLEQLRKRQRDEALQAQEELLEGVANSAAAGKARAVVVEPTTERESILTEEVERYDRAMSPTLIDITKLPYEERQIDIVLEIDDKRALFEQRRAVAASRFIPKAAQPAPEEQDAEAASGADLASEALYRAEAERDMDEEEELFNLEENIVNPTTYNWEDKYRPRKPRYFNRVHTGYEWNKYNQTHYDTDNPPPKVVQGYKFNIFYPDLIDKSKAPSYKIVKEPGNDDTVLLHFTAGPPYEDIAFRIVNREWEFSHKRGFRSSFDRGCLSLWFNFRRNLPKRTVSHDLTIRIVSGRPCLDASHCVLGSLERYTRAARKTRAVSGPGRMLPDRGTPARVVPACHAVPKSQAPLSTIHTFSAMRGAALNKESRLVCNTSHKYSYHRPAVYASPITPEDLLPSIPIRRWHRSTEDIEAQRGLSANGLTKLGPVLSKSGYSREAEMNAPALNSARSHLPASSRRRVDSNLNGVQPPFSRGDRMFPYSVGYWLFLMIAFDDVNFSSLQTSPTSFDSVGHDGSRKFAQELPPDVFISKTQSSHSHAIKQDSRTGTDSSNHINHPSQTGWPAALPGAYPSRQAENPLVDPKQGLIPTASKEDKRTLSAFSEWVVDYLYLLATTGRMSDEPSASNLREWHSNHAYQLAVNCIRTVLLNTLLPRTVVFLALWYSTRLPLSPTSVVYSKDVARSRFQHTLKSEARTIEDYFTKTFLVGLMIAEKWLNDNAYGLKAWGQVTGISRSILKSLEISALSVLNHDLRISANEWQQWLGHLRHWNACLAAPQLVCLYHTAPCYYIGRAIEEIGHASDLRCDGRGAASPHFLKALQPQSPAQAASSAPAQRAHTSNAHPSSLSIIQPARRSTRIDPIASRPRKNSAAAPGHAINAYHRCLHPFVAVQSTSGHHVYPLRDSPIRGFVFDLLEEGHGIVAGANVYGTLSSDMTFSVLARPIPCDFYDSSCSSPRSFSTRIRFLRNTFVLYYLVVSERKPVGCLLSNFDAPVMTVIDTGFSPSVVMHGATDTARSAQVVLFRILVKFNGSVGATRSDLEVHSEDFGQSTLTSRLSDATSMCHSALSSSPAQVNNTSMSTRSRSPSAPPPPDVDVDMENGTKENPDSKVVVVTNLTRNVVEAHLRTIFNFYGKIMKVDLPVYGKSGQNRGKAALEYEDSAAAHKAASHMNGGQLDGAVLSVELSDLPLVLSLVLGRVRALPGLAEGIILATAMDTADHLPVGRYPGILIAPSPVLARVRQSVEAED
ncbi:hypothetical protein EW146_g1159 [Bondarzewia mesenterica]|uniref:Splicing factor Cactin n=1 Tax=Bondarzewia mesenterica TaxID=1095465 RepID=A0A4S4M4V5_9AGAM|nr:hypothetical protein EW146_g1159 [Bondarzewia mesenterica]